MIENLVMLRCCSFRKKGRELQAKKRNSTYEGLIRICIASFFVLIFALLFNIIFVNKAEAAAKIWDGGGVDTNWTNPANWSPDGVPIAADTITINETTSKAVLVNTNINVASINVTSSYTNNMFVSGNITTNTFTLGANKELYMGGYDLTVSTTLTNSGTINLGTGNDLIGYFHNLGDFVSTGNLLTVTGNFHNWGNFIHNNGAVRLNSSLASQSIIGKDITFNVLFSNRAGGTITFSTPEATINVLSSLALTGVSGNEIKLRASSDGGLFYINPTGPRSISFIDVKDSKNIADTPIDPTNSIDSGRTINWWSPEETVSVYWTGDGTDTNWSNPEN